MTFSTEYVNLLIKQYWEKPNANAEIAMQAGTWERIFDLLSSFESEFDVDFATGDRLDILGRVVGVNRHVPSVVKKIFFGFDDNPDVTGFDDKDEQLGDLGPLFDKNSAEYTDLELDDHDFQFFIKAKIAKNNSHGVMTSDSFLSIQDSIIVLFDGMAYVEDNFDMSLTLHISYLVNEERIRVILALDLLPRPQGVRYILVGSEILNTFGFSENVNCKSFKNKFDSVTEPGGNFRLKLF